MGKKRQVKVFEQRIFSFSRSFWRFLLPVYGDYTLIWSALLWQAGNTGEAGKPVLKPIK